MNKTTNNVFIFIIVLRIILYYNFNVIYSVNYQVFRSVLVTTIDIYNWKINYILILSELYVKNKMILIYRYTLIIRFILFRFNSYMIHNYLIVVLWFKSCWCSSSNSVTITHAISIKQFKMTQKYYYLVKVIQILINYSLIIMTIDVSLTILTKFFALYLLVSFYY